MSDEELTHAIMELCRVVKPGGLVAVKEVDISVWQYQPRDPKLTWRLLDALSDDNQMSGAIWERACGPGFERRGLRRCLPHNTSRAPSATPAGGARIHPHNLAFLSALTSDGRRPGVSDFRPDFCYREMWVLSLGIVVKF
nr:hypothetical protein [Rhizobium tubonense]